MTLLHFEDFRVGQIYDCGAHEITKDEIVAFASAFDPQPQHLDEDAGKRSLLGGLAASGWHVCAIGMRLFADGLILKSANRGGAGVQDCRWIKPVKPGDILRLDAHVVETKVSRSRPDVGFVTFEWRIFNQAEQVASVILTPILARREPGGA
ncbi:MAG: MaoC family dehydratase [Rhizomicrobium sp.]